MINILKWVQSNWVNLAQTIASVIAAASIIVKLTPTLKDDTVLLKVIKFLGKYIALNTNAPLDVERPK